ncbi:hypothetical protein BLX41_01915 [Pseudomonas protegens]|uniref:hypothetical protein n=1 Tax=Pseudomonas protegens TaxID=380021 RepID=UPI000F4C0D28|nr:hypothetical protein [Pseudomonas protegens]ROL82576.1 hypothetical protein BLX41_01915 [Pseudomonas protegens]
MRITLTDIHPTPAQDLSVGFRCAFGDGRGQWLGPRPQVGQDYEVELSLEDEFSWNDNLEPCAHGPARLHWDQGALQVSGRLVRVDEDGVAALAVGPSIILLSLRGDPERTPQWVNLRARQVSLQPIAL